MKRISKAIGLFIVLKICEVLFWIGCLVCAFGILLGSAWLLSKIPLTTVEPIGKLGMTVFFSFMAIFVCIFWIYSNCEKVKKIMSGRSTLKEEINNIVK